MAGQVASTLKFRYLSLSSFLFFLSLLIGLFCFCFALLLVLTLLKGDVINSKVNESEVVHRPPVGEVELVSAHSKYIAEVCKRGK